MIVRGKQLTYWKKHCHTENILFPTSTCFQWNVMLLNSCGKYAFCQTVAYIKTRMAWHIVPIVLSGIAVSICVGQMYTCIRVNCSSSHNFLVWQWSSLYIYRHINLTATTGCKWPAQTGTITCTCSNCEIILWSR